MQLGEILRLSAQRDPRKTAIIAGDFRMDFATYDANANRFAHLLLDAGIKKGDRVATALFNSPEYGIVHFGNARAGSVLVHISPMYAGPEIARIVERTRPRILVVDDTIIDKIDNILDGLTTVERLIVVGRDFEESISDFPDIHPKVEIDPAKPVAMTFTGGTTGEPKGAVVSHNARFVSAWTTAIEHRVTGEDITDGMLERIFSRFCIGK